MTNVNSYIGNYRIVSELASGAFGRVFLAQHVVLTNRTVALKLMHSAALASDEDRERFIQEARFLEILKHPYILPIIDVGLYEGVPYLVTEYEQQGSLRDYIKRQAPQRLAVDTALTILSQVGQGLYFAHEQNIIHRDLKPENILFNAKGEALLTDFGIATALATASVKVADNSGTPRYMAPEQFRGTISKEGDQYALVHSQER